MPGFNLEVSSPSPPTSPSPSPDTFLAPLPSSASNTLPFKINSATRQIHHHLNSLITSRLPLALPPYSSSPTLYYQGLRIFSQLFFAFESSWHNLVSLFPTSSKSSTVQPPNPSSDASLHAEHLQSILAGLIPAELWRSEVLRQDLAFLTRRAGDTDDNKKVAAEQEAEVEKELQTIERHILRVTSEKPHTLLAYAWVLYMALFSGGRWMRAQLADAGDAFWLGDSSNTAQQGDVEKEKEEEEHIGFRLFCFRGTTDDGEGVRARFKDEFSRADDLLSDEEKEDIVREAEAIFEMCIRLVEGLDRRIGTHLPPLGSGKDNSKAGLLVKQPRPPPALDTNLLTVQSPRSPRSSMLRSPVVFLHNNMHTFAAMMAVAFGLGSWYVLQSFGSDWRGSLVEDP